MLLKGTGIVGIIERMIPKRKKSNFFLMEQNFDRFSRKMAIFHKKYVFSKLIFYVFSLVFWTLMLKFYSNVGIQFLYKVAEGIFEKVFVPEIHTFLYPKMAKNHFLRIKMCVSLKQRLIAKIPVTL